MNTKEFAKKNGKKTEWVRERCKEGLMLSAKKKANGRWEIPEDAELPPCTGREAALILENIIERSSGSEVCIIPARMAKRGEAALDYLMNWGFIAVSPENGGASVTRRGSELLESMRGAKSSGSQKRKADFNTDVSVDVELPILKLHGGLNYRTETEEVPESEDTSDKRAG